jgi:hypothetical protein
VLKIPLLVFAASVDFSQWSLSIFGYPKANLQVGNLGMVMLSEWFLLEQKPRVQQPPKIRKIIGVKKSTERENQQSH